MIWRDCDVIVHRPGWRVVSWLARPESVNRIPRIPFDPHQIRFHLPHNNYSCSYMAFHNAHGAGCDHFTCSTPWQHKKVSQFDNTRYTMSAISAHQPYPTAYQVGALEMLAMCCYLTRVPLDLPMLKTLKGVVVLLTRKDSSVPTMLGDLKKPWSASYTSLASPWPLPSTL